MNITTLPTLPPSLTDQQILVIMVDSEALEALPDALPSELKTALGRAIQASGFTAKTGEILPLYYLDGSSYPNVVLLGVGNLSTLTGTQAQTVATQLYKGICGKDGAAFILIDQLPESLREIFSLALLNASYQFNEFKSKKSEHKLQSITLVGSATPAQLGYLTAVFHGQSLARDMGNMPPNINHPVYMAEQAAKLAAEYPQQLKLTVLDMDQMAELGMNAFLAVAKGSDSPGRLVVLEYTGEPDGGAPIALVGKGITFDTGGISIKPAANMDEMKYDMSGAGSVLGVMRSLCELRLPLNVVGAMACAENMPSGHASRPADIVKSMSGQTIEILNTDAEGRLVLCDTLTYIGRYNPRLVVDMATLTGACIVALGKVYSGLFSPDNELAQALIDAGETSQDRVWRMPVTEDYQELLDSPFADMGNIGGPTAGAVTAACFLQRFTREYRWAHLDIAGTANTSGQHKGSTGRPVPLLMQFLRTQATSP